MTEIPVRIGSRGTSRAVGLSGEPATGRVSVAEHGRPTVERLAHAVPHPSEPSLAHRDLAAGGRRTPTDTVVGVDAGGALEDLDDGEVVGAPRARGRGAISPEGRRTVASSSKPDPLDAPRPRAAAPPPSRAPWYSSGATGAIESRPRAHAESSRAASTSSRRRSTPAASSGPTSSRTRVDARRDRPPRSPRPARPGRPGPGTGRRRRAPCSSSAACLAGRAVGVVDARARSAASTASRSSRPASSAIRSRGGRASRPTSSTIGARRSASASSATARSRSRAQPARPSRACQVADGRRVAGERPPPGHRRVVACVGEVAVERPQAAHEPLGVGGDRLGHVAARRRDGADGRDRSLGAAEGRHPPGPLVEGGQRRGQPGRVALLGRAARRCARRTREAPPPSATSSRRAAPCRSPCPGSTRPRSCPCRCSPRAP